MSAPIILFYMGMSLLVLVLTTAFFGMLGAPLWLGFGLAILVLK